MALRFKLPVSVAVSGGWNGEIARVVEILAAGTADGRIPARPVMALIRMAALRDKRFMTAIARGDRQAAAVALKRIARAVIGPGVKPENAPSTAKAKGGDRRALRDVTPRGRGKHRRGRDRIYKDFKTDPSTD